MSAPMLRQFWSLERDIERDLLSKSAISQCVSRMHGSTNLDEISAPVLHEAAAFRASYAEANYQPDGVVVARSRSILIPGKIVVRAAEFAGMRPGVARQAMAAMAPVNNSAVSMSGC